ncbi:unnamed protein product [Schistosoma mattheei]|uniref:Leishmanolysin-like peptidase n=1 Tax=Schistosoma mattheei TaxID=31246 RepID=A0A183PQG3_9TREM|nr:unnamed protein product [Schistosoma mattheei]
MLTTFTYLSNIIDEQGGSDVDVQARINKSRAVYLQSKTSRTQNNYQPTPKGCAEPVFYTDGRTGKKFCKSQCKKQALCYDHPVPDQYSSGCAVGSGGDNIRDVYQDGPGFAPNEYVLFVESENKQGCLSGSTLAYAGPCEMHPTTDRPIMGSINFCPQKMEIQEPGKTMLVGTAIHELGHALVSHYTIDKYRLDMKIFVELKF